MPYSGGVPEQQATVKYHTVLSAKAIKILDRLDRKIEKRIQARLEDLAVNPSDPRISNKLETVAGKRYSRGAIGASSMKLRKIQVRYWS